MKSLARTLAAAIRKSEPNLTYDESKDLFKEVRRQLNLKPPRRRNNGTVKRMSKSELEAFLNAAYERDARTGTMMQTLYETGCRVSEFCDLEVDDFYSDECRIIVREGKGGKRREIPITSALSNHLKLYLEFSGIREGRVFNSQNGPRISPRRIQQLVKEIADAAGISMTVTPHTLRHTRLTLLAEAGMPKDHLQIFAGHTKPETTEIYTHTAALDVMRSFREATRSNG